MKIKVENRVSKDKYLIAETEVLMILAFLYPTSATFDFLCMFTF